MPTRSSDAIGRRENYHMADKHMFIRSRGAGAVCEKYLMADEHMITICHEVL
jgi:hypothetical protein